MFKTATKYLKSIAKLALGRGVYHSYAHQGEDVVIGGLLKWIKNGIYVDVGAYHPALYSNTYALYKKGWQGIVIDPNIDMKPMYAMMRPRDTFVHTAVGPIAGETPYYMFDDGAYNSFDEGRAKSWKASRGLEIKEVRRVSFKPLSQILHEQKITKIDFLNIDAEGFDFEVLKTHDWSIETSVIAIEEEEFNPDAPHGNAIYQYMHEKGYVLAGLAGLTLIFRKPKENNP